MNNTNTMNHITTAIQVSLNLHNAIDAYKLPAETRVKYDAIGQCLRSLLEKLQNEQDTNV